MMLLERKNLVSELLKTRKKQMSESDLLEDIKAILNEEELQRDAVKEKLSGNNSHDSNTFVFDLLETDRIFHINQIKDICIEYRLRFLNSNLFKGPVPEEAVSQIRELERTHDTMLSGFKIMAPSKLFYLKNYDDPLLLAPIGNDYYYLIHKWGNDLNAYRKLLVRPMRNFGNLLLFLLVASLFTALLITRFLFFGTHTEQFLLITFLFTFKSFCGIALYYCFWKGKNFNTAIWNSEYYNK